MGEILQQTEEEVCCEQISQAQRVVSKRDADCDGNHRPRHRDRFPNNCLDPIPRLRESLPCEPVGDFDTFRTVAGAKHETR